MATMAAAVSPVCTSSVPAPAQKHHQLFGNRHVGTQRPPQCCTGLLITLLSALSLGHHPPPRHRESTPEDIHESVPTREHPPCSGDMKSLTTTTTSANSCAAVPSVRNHPSSDRVRTCEPHTKACTTHTQRPAGLCWAHMSQRHSGM